MLLELDFLKSSGKGREVWEMEGRRRHKSRQFSTTENAHRANVILERLIWDQPFLRANWQEPQDVMYHGIDLNEAFLPFESLVRQAVESTE